jgi:hypothetical protein
MLLETEKTKYIWRVGRGFFSNNFRINCQLTTAEVSRSVSDIYCAEFERFERGHKLTQRRKHQFV